MSELFDAVNAFFAFIVPISDFLWEFPTNFEWYAQIPVLGNFALSILILAGAGIYFTIKTRFVQVKRFSRSIKIVANRQATETGISPFAAFMLSSAMRVGPGNIMGVTGAVSVGGPGAIFWMYVMALFGMATGFTEAVLAQLFKEKKGDEYVGGLPFYGMKIIGNKKWVGIVLALLFIIYALFNVPSQTFHLFTALGSVANTLGNTTYDRTSPVYYAIGIVLIVAIAALVLGGMKRVTKFTDICVPVMAVVYCGIVFILIIVNYRSIPYFFSAVIGGAFSPEAIFGGLFGVALQQGIKRGLMANEAGQGTITMAASAASNKHPIDQGLVQSMGVFFDTFIICSMAGFVVVMAHVWTGDTGVAWDAIRDDKLGVYMLSAQTLAPGVAMDSAVKVILSICYALFAFTTLIGMIIFAEISANMISKDKKFIMGIRLLGSLFFVPFGVLTVLANLQLGNIWYLVDLMNIFLVFINVPIILKGSKYVFKALEHYNRTDGKEGFVSARDIGLETSYWTEEAQLARDQFHSKQEESRKSVS
ncbi:alanine/glycine:cation symporter family protein [Aminipila terrae]|uniref:Amino acid carrier protein n=1 Tax=Aminipila terrae TaxID=2697030 RepID=A0A6P1MK40_9FIRM|nr:amino acid carrier protein [Aminipila terrae]QHI72408.1 amino acid carrier protein [Aminipila terrae]